jgi:hypothetical protein
VVAPAAHAAFEDELFVAVGIETRSGTTINGTCRRTPSHVFGITANGSCDRSDSGTKSGTLGDSLADLNFVGVGLTFVPVLDELFLVNAFHIDDWIGVCRAAGYGSCETYKQQSESSAHDAIQ